MEGKVKSSKDGIRLDFHDVSEEEFNQIPIKSTTAISDRRLRWKEIRFGNFEISFFNRK